MRSIRLLLDMNVALDWVDELRAAGWEVAHWSSIGDIRAKDAHILSWARLNGWTVMTHDLDFGAILANTKMDSPSVVQFRTRGMLPGETRNQVIQALTDYDEQLAQGALIVFDARRTRVRLLPLRR